MECHGGDRVIAQAYSAWTCIIVLQNQVLVDHVAHPGVSACSNAFNYKADNTRKADCQPAFDLDSRHCLVLWGLLLAVYVHVPQPILFSAYPVDGGDL